MLLCSVVAHIVLYNTTTLQHYNATKYLFLCFCSLLRSWQYPASGGFSGQCVAKRPSSPFHAQSARITCSSVPSASECPRGRGGVPGRGRGGGCLRSLLAGCPLRKQARALLHTRRMHPACAAIPQHGHRQSDAPCAAHWLCPACATAACALLQSLQCGHVSAFHKVSGTGRSAARVPPGH